MASTETYSNTSIINLASDNYTVNTGTVTRHGGTLTLAANSRCTFSKSFGNEGLNTTKLKVAYNVDTSNLTTRYNNNIGIQLKVHYLNREYQNGQYVYSDGNWQTIDMIPYSSQEDKGNYKNDIIDTDGSFIKEMKIIIRFSGTSGTIDLTKLVIYNTVDVDPDNIKDIIDEIITDDPDIHDVIDDIITDNIDDNMVDYYREMVTLVGTYIEPRTSDPIASELYAGRVWLREDLVV